MKQSISQKAIEIGRVIVATHHPEESELLDMLSQSVTELLHTWNEADPSKWPIAECASTAFSSLGFMGPAALRLATPRILILITAVLTNLVASEALNPDEMHNFIIRDLNKYGKIFSVPFNVVKHLEKTLPHLLITVPEELAEMETCWKVFTVKEAGRIVIKREPITIKDVRLLSLKTSEYIILINMLNARLPILYLDGQKLAVRAKAVEILACLLKKLGQVCTYEEIVEAVWGKLIEALPLSEGERFNERIEKTINVSLKRASPLLKDNIEPAGRGYKVKEGLLKYCIIER
jgi:hypothetical protein